MELKIKNSQITQDVVGKVVEFPKYTTQIINLANQNAQGTRPKVVGQMSELIKQFPGQTYEEWVSWYLDQMPSAVDDATERICEMVKNLALAVPKIDEAMVKRWVQDLVLTKTLAGFCFQESILKALSEKKHLKYKIATPQDESKGIDGYIDETPVSIKPLTYKTKNMLAEKIAAKMVYYEKLKDGIKVEYDF
jgi:hypothetical protein